MFSCFIGVCEVLVVKVMRATDSMHLKALENLRDLDITVDKARSITKLRVLSKLVFVSGIFGGVGAITIDIAAVCWRWLLWQSVYVIPLLMIVEHLLVLVILILRLALEWSSR
jgi:hypothetical protein